MSTRNRGKAPAPKLGASVAVSSSPLTVDSGVLSSLGVTLSHESARTIEDLFLKMDLFARRTYKNMVCKQLPLGMSDKLTSTGQGIWYFTYRLMCEGSFVSRCIGEYHFKYRPNFIRALPSIQVLSNSPDRDVVPLTGYTLLDFLSRLDCAIHNKVESIFSSGWSEVSVALEEESSNAVSCKDFIDVLQVAGIPKLALSPMLISTATSARRRGAVECTALGVSAADLTHSPSSSSQSLPPQSHHKLLSRTHSQSESLSLLGPSLPLREASSVPSELATFSSVVDYDSESYFDPTAVKKHKGGDSVPTHAEIGVTRSTVGVPSFSEASAIPSPTIQCVDLLGIKLHPDGDKLICRLFCEIRKFARNSFSHSIFNYISTIFSSELPLIGKAIWLKTYRELHLSKFMCKFICVYHYRYHPNLIRALDSILVLSSSSDSRLVPLSGVELLGFLSKLDCAIRREMESIFDLGWNEAADGVFSELEDGLLGAVSCKDFIRVLDVVGVPTVALSNSQRYNELKSRRRYSVSKKKTLPKTHLQSETQSNSLLRSEEDHNQSSSKFVKLFSCKDKSGSASVIGTASTVVTSLGGTGSSLTLVTEPVDVSAVSDSKGVSTRGGGRSPVQKHSTSIAVSSSASTADSDVLSLLGIKLSSESVQIIEGLFFKVNEFSRRTYNDTVSKQLPSSVSNKLTVTGQAIWYFTYRMMCEDIFVFKCLAEYHANHRPGFIRALPDIKVLSDSPDRNIVPLVGDGLLGFLSKLDCAVLSKVKSVFRSDWDKAVSVVYVALREESLNDVSCKDLVDVLDIAGIPPLAFTGLVRSLPSSSQPLPHRSNPELSPRARDQSESQLSSVGDSAGRFSSDQCVDLLGVKLHPGSAELVYKLFFDVRRSARMSFSNSMLNHILTTVNSELSAVGKAIWCKTYKELHLSRFMYRSICMYHAKYRPDFIRDLGSVRVLSSSSDCRLVPLNGGELLGFLSRLDCAIHEIVDSVFNLLWDDVANRILAELEAGSLSNVNCEDFITVLDVVDVPVVAFSISQRCVKVRAIGENRTSESSSKCAVESTESGSSIIDLTHSSVTSFSQLQSQQESSLPFVTESVAVPTLSVDSFLSISGDVLVSTVDVSASASALGVGDGLSVEPSSSLSPSPAHAPSPVPVVASDIPPYLPPLAEDLVAVSVVSALRGAGDDSLSPSSSPSIGPLSSPSIGPSSPSLSSSPSELGLDADVSSSSTESSVSDREIFGLATEVIVSESGVLVGESTPVCSSEQPIVPITASSSVSISSIGEPSTAVSSSSSGYVHGLKKAFAMRFKGPFEVSTTSNVVAEPSSSISMSSSVVSGTSSSAPVGVGSVPPVAAATDTIAEDVGVRLAALLNRDLPPSPPPASGSMRGARGRLSSSHRGSAQRGRGRKRKRNS
ncbi:hypothetical protein [Candidatus Ichthyocystis sparus]|uniref:hypothetical protein n=1 Tax=Candidatus Ichthyocystis sparus TaxID=1561004 RepID=UPI000B899C52|nr:hypothetical protein [Candidatus Ichthyocystis sparus]